MAEVIETAERAAALAALAEGIAREIRLWCAEQDEAGDPAVIEALAISAAPGVAGMLERRGFDLRRRTRWTGQKAREPAGRTGNDGDSA